MPATYPILKRAASAAFLLSLLAACQDIQTTTAPLDLQPRLTQLAASPVVNSLADPGTGTCDDTECTLREAIAFASSGATITFSVTGTITLSGSQLRIATPMTISGPGSTLLTVNGNGASRVFMIDAAATITGMTIKGGYVGSGGGGGLMAWASLTLIDCTVSGNSSLSSVGGGLYLVFGTLLVESSTVSGNTGHSSAGGVYAGSSSSAMTFRNSTVSTNYAITGGLAIGINSLAALLQIDHSTVTGNGVGIYVDAGAAQVKGSVVSGNLGDDIVLATGSVTSLGHNLIGGTYPVSLLTEFTETGDQTGVTNALLDTLALNVPATTRTHALLEGSPAIDAGICTDIAGATLSADQRGVTRPQGSACDIGSYERQVSGGTTPTFVFSLSALPAKTFGDGSFSVTTYASTNSTGAVTFTNGTGSVGCSVSGAGMVTITGAAVDPSGCIIEASLAADATYTGAGPISQTFNIAKAAGSVTINNIPSSASVGGSFTPTYTKAGDGNASTVSNSPTICTVTSGVVNYIAAGTCLLQASVTAGANHLAATGNEQSFTLSLATPTFSFDLSGLTAKTYGDGSFSVAGYATTNSTGAITFAAVTGSTGCSVTPAGMVNITGVALDPVHCVIAATLAADGSYAAAGPIEQSFNIVKAAGSVGINNIPASATVGGQFTPAFTMFGDGTASVVSLTEAVCTVSGGVVTFNAAGTCTLQASVTEGTNYLPATGSQENVTVSIAPAVFGSSCTYTIHPKNSQRQVTVTWANADPGVTEIQVADGRIFTRQLAPTTTGSWSTNVKTGVPSYGLWGGVSRRDTSTNLVDAGTACTLVP